MSARILVVDDLEANRRLLEAKLGADYYDVLTAQRGEEAVQLAKREKPDLILMDVMMPGGIDGYEACRRLKAMPETRHIPVVILTTLDDRDNFRQHAKDEKMAINNPEQYCADRCLATGNCDVYEDL